MTKFKSVIKILIKGANSLIDHISISNKNQAYSNYNIKIRLDNCFAHKSTLTDGKSLKP